MLLSKRVQITITCHQRGLHHCLASYHCLELPWLMPGDKTVESLNGRTKLVHSRSELTKLDSWKQGVWWKYVCTGMKFFHKRIQYMRTNHAEGVKVFNYIITVRDNYWRNSDFKAKK